MSLFGALQLGASSLAAQQTALQVTGNNIANAGTEGYSRQVVQLAPGADVQTSSGQYVGTGVTVVSVQRQVSAAVNEGLRDATSGKYAADTLNTQLTQLQSTFGALNSGDLASQLTSFFNSFSTLANDPGNSGQRAIVIQNGKSLADNIQSLRQQVGTLRDNTQAQIGTVAQQADSLAKQIANLNGQIASAGSGGSATNALLDQRDLALSQLSQIMDIRVFDNGGGNLNVLVGSVPLVTGSTTRGVSTKSIPDASGATGNTQVVFGDNGDPMNPTGGQLGGFINARDNYFAPAISTLDSLAAGLISAVNTIHSQGQGLSGFSSVTGTTDVLDPNAALNAPSASTGIAFPPTNGSFNLYITDASTGQTTIQQVNVNLSGQGTQTSLSSLASDITAAGGGSVNASVTPAGTLQINAANANITFGFGEDTSGTLAGLGINTFFTGSSAQDIAVNQSLENDPDLLAAGRGNNPGSNANAQALALAGSAAVAGMGGQSVTNYYTNYIGNLAAQSKTASDNATTHSAIHDTLYSQQQALSGVNMDEEAINLMQFQRAFQGSANFINIVNQMMQTVIALIPAA